MKVPHHALVALANGERLLILRNVGQPFEPKLERVSEPDLLLTNFSAGVRHQDPAVSGAAAPTSTSSLTARRLPNGSTRRRSTGRRSRW